MTAICAPSSTDALWLPIILGEKWKRALEKEEHDPEVNCQTDLVQSGKSAIEFMSMAQHNEPLVIHIRRNHNQLTQWAQRKEKFEWKMNAECLNERGTMQRTQILVGNEITKS